MKTFKGFLYGVAIAIAVSAGAATIYNYFPPPGMTYSPTAGLTVGTPTGGAQGTGTVNAQGVFVNGTAVASSVAPGANTQVVYNNSGAYASSSLLTFTPGSVLLNIGGATTPGTFSVGQLDAMVINGVTVPIPGFALNSNIQGVFENHSYVNGVASGGARYYGVRSEGTISSPAIVVNGDHLSTFYAAGYNGSSYSLGGDILFQVNGTPGASAMPTDLLFQLSPAASQVPATVLQLYHDGGAVFGAPTGGDQGVGTINMQGCFVNGVACSTGGASGGNPTGTVGLTAVNGVAGTYMRSDAAPPLSQAISPTWTGLHTFISGGNTTPSVEVGNGSNYGILTVGLGTPNANATPGDPPHIFEVINSDNSMQGVRISSYGSAGNAASVLHFVRMNGTITSPTALTSGENFLSIGARGYDVAPTGSAIAIEGITTENWSSGHNGSELDFQTTPAGSNTSARANVLQLTNALSTFTGPVKVKSTGQVLIVNTTTATGGGQNYIRFSDPTNNMGYVGFAGSDSTLYVDNQLSGSLHLKTNDTDAMVIGSDQGITVGSPTGGDKGAGTINAQAIYVNGAAVPTSAAAVKFAAGTMTTSGGNTCVVSSNVSAVASCTEAAAGRPVVNFTTGYFTALECTATSLSANQSQTVNLNGISLNSIQAYISQSGSNVDGSFSISCVGN